jgi:hypothetical protein
MDDPEAMPRLEEIANGLDLSDTIDWVQRHIYPGDKEMKRRASDAGLAKPVKRSTPVSASASPSSSASSSTSSSSSFITIGQQTSGAGVVVLHDALPSRERGSLGPRARVRQPRLGLHGEGVNKNVQTCKEHLIFNVIICTVSLQNNDQESKLIGKSSKKVEQVCSKNGKARNILTADKLLHLRSLLTILFFGITILNIKKWNGGSTRERGGRWTRSWRCPTKPGTSSSPPSLPSPSNELVSPPSSPTPL